jgi:hypothetical protein
MKHRQSLRAFHETPAVDLVQCSLADDRHFAAVESELAAAVVVVAAEWSARKKGQKINV